MALAFDAQSTSTFSSTSSVSWSHTCTGSDRILIVGVYATIDNINTTNATYNGVTMTFMKKAVFTSGAANGQSIYLFYLINPSSGSNTVTVNASSGNVGGYGAAASYTGAKQSSQPDASNSGFANSGSTSFTTSVTTTADNCWLVGFGYGQTASAGSGTTFRSQPVSGVLFIMDSNGAKTPAGSYGLTFTQSSNFASSCVASIAPAPISTIPDLRLAFM